MFGNNDKSSRDDLLKRQTVALEKLATSSSNQSKRLEEIAGLLRKMLKSD